MKQKEIILCAAIWYKELSRVFWRKDIPITHLLPRNVQTGMVFCGHRHLQCLYQMIAMTGKRQCEAGEEIQGFLTNKNRFVTREQAAKIAWKEGQIKNKVQNLFSEDLY